MKTQFLSFFSYVCSVLVVCVYRRHCHCITASDSVYLLCVRQLHRALSRTPFHGIHITNFPATVGDWLRKEFRVAIHGNLLFLCWLLSPCEYYSRLWPNILIRIGKFVNWLVAHVLQRKIAPCFFGIRCACSAYSGPRKVLLSLALVCLGEIPGWSCQ